MGSSSKQTTGYRYFSNFLLFIGNPIEKLLGINFDKRGWQNPLVDENQNTLDVGTLNLPNLYGENEGGVAGKIYAQYGTNDQPVVPFYKSYMDAQDLPASAFPYQSYLAFTGLGEVPVGGWAGSIIGSMQGQYNSSFYLGNSGYMKEMLLWPKRIHVRNDGRPQWYNDKAEIGENMAYSEISSRYVQNGNIYNITGVKDIPAGIPLTAYTNCIGGITGNFSYTINTKLTFAGAGSAASDELKKRYGIYEIFKDTDLKFGGYTGSSDLGIFLDHAHAWYPNWDEIKEKTMANRVVVNSVGFSAMYLIELKSRTKHKDFSIAFGSSKSFILRNIQVENFNDGYVQGRYLAIILDAHDQASIAFNTENDLNAGTYLKIESHIQCSVVDLEMTFGGTITGPDINPIHKIREILTDDTAMNKPESDVNDLNFMKAADRIYDEGLGISWSITEKSCLDAINELCGHIEAGVRVNRQTGLYEMVLFRDDWFSDDEIHSLEVSKIKSMSLEVANADEAINQLNVSYYNRDAIKDSSFSVAENASI
ncbi:MAG: hypothetical protein ACN6NX_13305, partial [Acinetobacter sp.]